LVSYCKNKKKKIYISNNLKAAIKYNFNGLYIPSFNKSQNFINHSNKNLIIIGSAHNQMEIYQKIQQNCKAIFLSPIFQVKKNKKHLNIYKFNSLSRGKKIRFIPLGGINNKNIQKLNLLTNVKGFAGISIFKKKPAFKRPVF